MVSEEGLNAYGALTWGQFFIYQGFNERAGWMHTSSGVDNIDEYLETVVKKGDGFAYSPKKTDYPVYVERGNAESPRGIHAIRVLENKRDFTLDSLIAAAYDSYLPAFEDQIPALVKAYDKMPAANPLKKKLSEQIALLTA